MKKLFTAVLFLLIVTSMGATLLAKPTIVSTHAVFGEFAQIVGGDSIDVVTIIPSGFCPAHYDLRPSDVAAVSKAALMIYSGFEPWMDSLLESVGGNVTTLQLNGSWSRPDDAAEKVDGITEALCELLPENTDMLEANAAAYKDRLTTLAASLKARAKNLNVTTIPVISMQWQAAFVSWLGFDIATTYGMPENLSMKDLVELTQAGAENEVVLVIDNLQSGLNFGAKLAVELGVVHVVLSNFPGAMPATATVLDLFEHNANALFSAIKPLE